MTTLLDSSSSILQSLARLRMPGDGPPDADVVCAAWIASRGVMNRF
jgi:hypothetical protein